MLVFEMRWYAIKGPCAEGEKATASSSTIFFELTLDTAPMGIW